MRHIKNRFNTFSGFDVGVSPNLVGFGTTEVDGGEGLANWFGNWGLGILGKLGRGKVALGTPDIGCAGSGSGYIKT